ncbi:MAG: BlaI/MecI/CopY family transcriptional regulator [bacterium]
MKELTKAEEQVMQILWSLESAIVRDIMTHFPDPKPAYTTVSTIVRILEKKGFVEHENYGNIHKYSPLVSKDEYASEFMNYFVKDYFGNSFSKLVSFFGQKEKISPNDLEEIRKLLIANKEKGAGND